MSLSERVVETEQGRRLGGREHEDANQSGKVAAGADRLGSPCPKESRTGHRKDLQQEHRVRARRHRPRQCRGSATGRRQRCHLRPPSCCGPAPTAHRQGPPPVRKSQGQPRIAAKAAYVAASSAAAGPASAMRPRSLRVDSMVSGARRADLAPMPSPLCRDMRDRESVRDRDCGAAPATTTGGQSTISTSSSANSRSTHRSSRDDVGENVEPAPSGFGEPVHASTPERAQDGRNPRSSSVVTAHRRRRAAQSRSGSAVGRRASRTAGAPARDGPPTRAATRPRPGTGAEMSSPPRLHTAERQASRQPQLVDTNGTSGGPSKRRGVVGQPLQTTTTSSSPGSKARRRDTDGRPSGPPESPPALGSRTLANHDRWSAGWRRPGLSAGLMRERPRVASAMFRRSQHRALIPSRMNESTTEDLLRIATERLSPLAPPPAIHAKNWRGRRSLVPRR